MSGLEVMLRLNRITRMRYYCTPVPGESKWSSASSRGEATANQQVDSARGASQKRNRDDNQEMTEATDTPTTTKRSMGDNDQMDEAVATDAPESNGDTGLPTSASATEADNNQVDCIIKVHDKKKTKITTTQNKQHKE